MSEKLFLTHYEILKKFDNHEIIISDLGKNMTHTARELIKQERYIDFLERKITQLEERLDIYDRTKQIM